MGKNPITINFFLNCKTLSLTFGDHVGDFILFLKKLNMGKVIVNVSKLSLCYLAILNTLDEQNKKI
jgi:hypothetical protein